MGSVALGKRKGKKINVNEKNTWLAYDFENNDRQYCFADFLVLTMRREKNQTQNVKTGKNVMIELVKPDFFFEYQRLELVNPKKSSFDGNTHKATFFKKALKTMSKELRNKKEMRLLEKIW